jgi:hypothetical protein
MSGRLDGVWICVSGAFIAAYDGLGVHRRPLLHPERRGSPPTAAPLVIGKQLVLRGGLATVCLGLP